MVSWHERIVYFPLLNFSRSLLTVMGLGDGEDGGGGGGGGGRDGGVEQVMSATVDL